MLKSVRGEFSTFIWTSINDLSRYKCVYLFDEKEVWNVWSMFKSFQDEVEIIRNKIIWEFMIGS
jgi:hypothetical protein